MCVCVCGHQIYVHVHHSDVRALVLEWTVVKAYYLRSGFSSLLRCLCFYMCTDNIGLLDISFTLSMFVLNLYICFGRTG